MGTEPVLSIVVPCYNRPEQLKRLLRELAVQDLLEPFELVVVDDGSSRPLAPLVEAASRELGLSATCVRTGKLGSTAARNAGARLAGGRLLLFLDDDMHVAPDFLRAHLEAQHRVGPAAISALYEIRLADDHAPVARWYAARAARWATRALQEYREFDHGINAADGQHLSSTNACIPAAAFWSVDGFDERYRVPSCEDMDLGVRLTRRGIPVYRISTTRPVHLEERTSLRELCLRQRSGARETVRLVRKFPDIFVDPGIGRVNGPVRPFAEALSLTSRKLVKSLIALPPSTVLVFWIAEGLSRSPLPQRLVFRIYDAIVGAFIQAGWREGLALHPMEVPGR